MPSTLVLVSGPSRGGKSRWAEHLLAEAASVTYLATSGDRPDDVEWQRRLELHRNRRPAHWRLVETGADLTLALQTVPDHSSVLIDALGGFVAWHLDRSEEDWQRTCTALIQQLQAMVQICVLVIEETGWGVVPPTRVGGLFRDRLGTLAQRLEQHSQASWLVLQGRALDLHAISQRIP